MPRRYYGRWFAAALILLAFALLVQAFAAGQIAWKVVAQFFTAKAILIGLENTIIMTVCAMVLGILRETLDGILRRYTSEHRQHVVAAFEGWSAKYSVTLDDIELTRDLAAKRLRGFLGGLGYDRR